MHLTTIYYLFLWVDITITSANITGCQMQLFLSSLSFCRGRKGQNQNKRSQTLPYSTEKDKAYKVGWPKPGSLPLSRGYEKNFNSLIVRITRDNREDFLKETRWSMFLCLLREKGEILPAHLKPSDYNHKITTQRALTRTLNQEGAGTSTKS